MEGKVWLVGAGPGDRGLFTLKGLEVLNSAEVGVYDARFLKPLDEKLLREIAGRYSCLITVEDGSLSGGLFGAVSEFCAREGLQIPLEGLGIPDRFISQAKQSEQYASCGLDTAGIQKSLQKVFENRK